MCCTEAGSDGWIRQCAALLTQQVGIADVFRWDVQQERPVVDVAIIFVAVQIAVRRAVDKLAHVPENIPHLAQALDTRIARGFRHALLSDVTQAVVEEGFER